MRTGGVRGKERLGILPTDHTGRKGDKVMSNATHFNKSPPSKPQCNEHGLHKMQFPYSQRNMFLIIQLVRLAFTDVDMFSTATLS